MLHNLVITQKGESTVDKVADMALKLGLDGADLNYVPDTDMVIVHTGILEPGTSEKIYFQVALATWRVLDCMHISGSRRLDAN